MNFESLSSEIFFDIFDFLDHIHIFHSFSNLNDRFNNLLLTYFRVSPRLNLQFITKSHFDMVCNYFIPYFADNLHALRLSNDDNTPQQIDLFLSYGLSLYKFPNLKSLSLHYIHSETIINRMMIEWQYPINLTHLIITDCQLLNDWNIAYTLFNNIWSLPKLTHCKLDIDIKGEMYCTVPTTTSLTLECLSIKNLYWYLEELISLFEYTPCLRYLDVMMDEKIIHNSPLLFSVPLLTTLKLTYEGSFIVLENLMKNVTNLCNWTIRTINVNANGEHWAQIISNYLLKLKNFYLLMQFDNGSDFSLSQLVNTYKSDFWLKERQWYVRGHDYFPSYDANATIFLYTLPYAFDDYYILLNHSYATSKSYFSNFNDQTLYERVNHLSCILLSTNRYSLSQRFCHIYHLTLKLPFHNNWWTFLPTFDHLRILDISFSYIEAYNRQALFQFQTLLDQAPKLYSLKFQSSIDLVLPFFECTSESLIKLDLQNYGEDFNKSNCATLFLSKLGKQCQILSIKVDDQMNILQLVKEMPQLRTLNVRLPLNKYKTDDDKLIKWLRRQLPSSCIITRDVIHSNRIQIWIR